MSHGPVWRRNVEQKLSAMTGKRCTVVKRAGGWRVFIGSEDSGTWTYLKHAIEYALHRHYKSARYS